MNQCQTICDGKIFWLLNQDVLVPRKCTQSIIRLCHRQTSTPYIKKTYHTASEYKKEKRMLLRVQGYSCFPQLQHYMDAKLELNMSYKGLPVTPATIPIDCKHQVKNFYTALAKVNIQHNDLVPHNVVVDCHSNQLSLIDFGRSKKIKTGDKGIKQRAQQLVELNALALVLCNHDRLEWYQREQLNKTAANMKNRRTTKKQVYYN